MPSAIGYRRTMEWEVKITNQWQSDGYMFSVYLTLNRLHVPKVEGKRIRAVTMETRLQVKTVENSSKCCGFTWSRAFTWMRPNVLLPRRGQRRVSDEEERLPVGNENPPNCVITRVIPEIPAVIYVDIQRIMRSTVFRPRWGVVVTRGPI